MNTSKKDIVNLVELLKQLGLTHAVISPGSRNAPLIKAFAQEKSIRCYSIVDERSAAFFALGISQQSKQATALICTSGSALLNYAPALVEAFYQQIPLLVISADRPEEWIDQADGQTINQHEIYKNYTKAYYKLKESKGDKTAQWFNERSITEAFATSMHLPKGPVHINVPLSEPLYAQANEKAELLKPACLHFPMEQASNASSIELLAKEIAKSKRVLVLVGQHAPNKELTESLLRLAENPQLVILTETTANVFDLGFIDQIDRFLATIKTADKPLFEPEVLLTFGGMVVSKRLKMFLRGIENLQHWNIAASYKHTDTYQKLSHHVEGDAVPFIKNLSGYNLANSSTYKSVFQTQQSKALALHTAFCAKLPYSDFLVFNRILAALPKNSQLQIGNSSAIRYVQLFNNTPTVAHFCNRGVSGIDGCTSTAMGAATLHKTPTVLLSGDISFFYDANGLWNNYCPTNFVGFVINNQGGNIFRIIDGPSNFDEMPEFIETEHNKSIKPLAELHNFRYFACRNEEELNAVLSTTFDGSVKTLVEIFTPQKESPELLDNYWAYLSTNANKPINISQ